mmetsp:Transcript_26156/g.53861  ORF Transcript_26156/g.53861 Transcript_26156/m.53861 type:complete len:702 (+) Transcript_26156:265-2370(+)
MAKIKRAKKSKEETTTRKTATANASSTSPLNNSSTQRQRQQQQKQTLEESDDEDKDEPTIPESNTGHQDVQHKKREDVMSESKLAEEAALTDLLFGGGGGGTPGEDASSDGGDDDGNGENTGRGVIGDDFDGVNDIDDFYERKKRKEFDRSDVNGGDGDEMKNVWDGDIFAIDRSGVDVPSDDGEEEGENQLVDIQAEDDDDEDEDEDDSSEEDEGVQGKASMKGAAWQDDDEEDDNDDGNKSKTRNARKGISLVEGSDRIKKLRRYRDETNPISFSEYELRLRERFVNTASVAARTDWADVPKPEEADDSDGGGSEAHKRKKIKGYASSSEDEDDDDEYDAAASRILQSNASLFANSSSQLPLPPTLLNVVRQRDANVADPNRSAVNAVQFHPSSEAEDNPLLMTAGMDKMLKFFKVDGEENHKIHGIHFPQMPIMCASFLGDTGSVVLSGRRPFFYVYDAISGNIQKIPSIIGRSERSLERFSISPDGKIIAFVGNDGYIILLDGKSRQWIGDLKMNGSVRAISFTPDGEYIMGSGSDGDVYRWHIRSRRCIERFHNQDGTITSSMASSSNFLAVGAESGVVNLYNDKHHHHHHSTRHPLASTSTDKTPLKSIMNLQTSADMLKFSDDGQILAMSTRRETNGLKLLHVPSGTVFSNWPTSKTPLKYVWSMDFSPGSKYFAIGNDHGKCLLYQLKHYWDE